MLITTPQELGLGFRQRLHSWLLSAILFHEVHVMLTSCRSKSRSDIPLSHSKINSTSFPGLPVCMRKSTGGVSLYSAAAASYHCSCSWLSLQLQLAITAAAAGYHCSCSWLSLQLQLAITAAAAGYHCSCSWLSLQLQLCGGAIDLLQYCIQVSCLSLNRGGRDEVAMLTLLATKANRIMHDNGLATAGSTR